MKSLWLSHVLLVMFVTVTVTVYAQGKSNSLLLDRHLRWHISNTIFPQILWLALNRHPTPSQRERVEKYVL